MSELDTEMIKVTRSGPVAIVTMTNPKKKNAFGLNMRTGMLSVVHRLMHFDADCRSIVLTGAGGAFCTGGDISEMKERTHLQSRERMEIAGQIMKLLMAGPKPVIAAIEGPAFGAGFSLAMAGDYAVAATNARFCAAFVRVGLLPDTGLLWSLNQRLGRTKAKQLMMLATELSGQQALEMGIVDEAVEPGKALERAIQVAESYAGMPPVALALIKEAVMRGTDTMEGALKTEIDFQPVVFGTSDHREAVKAFLEKRKPVFTGE